MDVHEKVNFAQALHRNGDVKKRANPEAIPDGLVKLYDEAKELNNWLCRSGNIDSRTLWVIAKMADIYEKLQDVTLRLQAAEAKIDEEPEPETKIDLRTKEGRAMKAAMVGVG